jgi:hypothetical protein
MSVGDVLLLLIHIGLAMIIDNACTILYPAFVS